MTHTALASLVLGPIEFSSPLWLVLAPALGAWTLLISRRSLAGLGRGTRIAALGTRLLVIGLLVGALGEPQLRRESRDVALSVIVDASESVPTDLQRFVDTYVLRAAEEDKKPDDRLGVITAAKDAYVQSLPSRLTGGVERQFIGATDGTNLAAATQLGLATAPKDAALRIVLASDGLETEGNLLQAAETARAAGVPVDVLPLRYRYDNEVVFERLVAPGSARQDEIVNLRAVLSATRPATGRLTVLLNDETLDLDPSSDTVALPVELLAGTNVIAIPVPVGGRGAHEFRAVFEPDVSAAGIVQDAITENNTSMAVTFVSGEGRVLVLRGEGAPVDEAQALVAALAEAGIRGEVDSPERMTFSITSLNSYDAVVMVNQESYPYTEEAQMALRQYVHDSGGGLVMIGGDRSFGAGGWIGSPLEDALPIRLDPPQKRQMPRGALALVIHSVEMPQGTFYGKKVCQAAVDALSRLDYVGIVEYGWQGGVDWTLPLAPKGDGGAARQAINKLVFGDMPDFDPSLNLALQGLLAVDAGQRHVIVISDGDPNLSNAVLQKYKDNRVTISSVGVYPHSRGDLATMRRMAEYTGGTYYEVTTNQALANLPQIFVKEAQTVKRSLIWEGPAFQPVLVRGVDTMRGISALPPITGYVVAAEREGLAQVTIRGKENDPVGAQWQYGLGRVVTFTSDATARWTKEWLAWGQFRQFWEQQMRWVMRPSGSPNVRILTEQRGDDTLVTVEAVDNDGQRLPTASFRGRIASPDGQGRDIELHQVGPGRFEALVPTPSSGTYVMSLRYRAPPPVEGGPVLEGSAQAAVIRPFADEFRALQDNAGLLQQVADITGGRVLGPDPRLADLWSRTGLVMPVATRAIWIPTALAGVALFLFDVAVRRVRIDIFKIARAARASLARGSTRAGMGMEGLQAARAKARQAMDAKSTGAPTSGAAAEPGAGRVKPVQAGVARRKFEATEEQARALRDASVALGGEPETPEQERRRAAQKPTTTEGDEQGMSRLLKAKQRARDEMKDE